MSRSYWIIGISALVGVSALCMLVFYSGYGSAKIENRAEHHTKEYANSSYSRMQDTCTDREGVELFKCIGEIVESTHEHQRSEDDLNAQRKMAKWAFWMLVVALITAAITAVGVYYVAKTLNATGKTLKATQIMATDQRRIGEAQVRAYPSVVSVSFRGITNGLPSFTIVVKNSGNSPALRIKCRGRLMLSYQEDILPVGTVAQLGMEISVASTAQASIPPNFEGKVGVFTPHSDDSERNVTMKEMASISPRKNPFWSVNIFFDWVDVFGREYNFYINAEQYPNIRSRAVVGAESAMSDGVLTQPFNISYQSESRNTDED